MAKRQGDDFWDDVASDIAHELVVEVAVEGIKWAAEGIGRWMREASKTLVIDGAVGYTISGSRIEIRAEMLKNRRSGGNSGTLMLKLWAVDSPYEGGSLTGYVFGSKRFESLQGGWNYNNIKHTSEYYKPPSGTYYVVATLNEYEDGDWPIYDWVNFDNKLIV